MIAPHATPKKRSRIEATAIPVPRAYAGPATQHVLHEGDARELSWLPDESLHLVMTSPPYFNLKKYNDRNGQLGHINDYETFLDQLDQTWRHCYRALVPGGRLVINVGDVCVSRKSNGGRHHVIPLHADVSVRCRRIGFDYLTPILWHKIANAAFEAKGNGAGFLGKPYEPNAIVKNDVEYILMLRKHGKYRSPTEDQRATSRLTKEEQSAWFRPIWEGLTGASTRAHPAPYPVELAYRLIRMFSFTGDTVLDPFSGTGTTSVAALRSDRNSIGNELDPAYMRIAEQRLREQMEENGLLPSPPTLKIRRTAPCKRGQSDG